MPRIFHIARTDRRLASSLPFTGLRFLLQVYLEEAFDGTPWRPAKRFPAVREPGGTSLMFLVHPSLTQDEIDRTCEAIRQVTQQAQR